jgi:hypothetical protein
MFVHSRVAQGLGSCRSRAWGPRQARIKRGDARPAQSGARHLIVCHRIRRLKLQGARRAGTRLAIPQREEITCQRNNRHGANDHLERADSGPRRSTPMSAAICLASSLHTHLTNERRIKLISCMRFMIAGEMVGTPGRSAGVMWTIRMSREILILPVRRGQRCSCRSVSWLAQGGSDPWLASSKRHLPRRAGPTAFSARTSVSASANSR